MVNILKLGLPTSILTLVPLIKNSYKYLSINTALLLSNVILALIVLLNDVSNIKLTLVMLSTLIGNLVVNKGEKSTIVLLQLLNYLVVLCFITEEIIWFYIGFELLLLPIFLIIYYSGQSEDKIKTSYKFMYFALGTSLFWLLSIIVIYQSNIVINTLYGSVIFLIPLLVKIPLPPLHLWLNDTHTASPVSGSILLAGTILKISVYGLIVYFTSYYVNNLLLLVPLLIILSIPGAIYSSFSCLVQVDYKRFIAYTSVTHMSVIFYGYVVNVDSIIGSIIMLIAHGITSSSLFYHVNQLYEQYHTKLIYYLRGITYLMPYFSIIALFLHLLNLAFPPSINWYSEYFIFGYAFDNFNISTLVIGITILAGMYYSIWVYLRVYFGLTSKYLVHSNDISYLDYYSLILLIAIGSFGILFIDLI